MRCALIKDGVVVNVIEADPEKDSIEGCSIVALQEADPGDVYADGALTKNKRQTVEIPAPTGNTKA